MIFGEIIPDIIPEEKKPLEPHVEVEEFEEDEYCCEMMPH